MSLGAIQLTGRQQTHTQRVVRIEYHRVILPLLGQAEETLGHLHRFLDSAAMGINPAQPVEYPEKLRRILQLQ